MYLQRFVLLDLASCDECVAVCGIEVWVGGEQVLELVDQDETVEWQEPQGPDSLVACLKRSGERSQRLSVVEELRVQKTMVIMMLSNTHEIIGTVSEAIVR
jgi:hypothetical protein